MKQVKMKVNQIFEVIESAENVKINRKLDGAYENITKGKLRYEM